MTKGIEKKSKKKVADGADSALIAKITLKKSAWQKLIQKTLEEKGIQTRSLRLLSHSIYAGTEWEGYESAMSLKRLKKEVQVQSHQHRQSTVL